MCFHDRLKTFTFSNGVEIKMCPDCTTFDEKRKKVLNVSKVATIDMQAKQHWGLILNDAGLSNTCGLHEWLMFESDIINIQPHRQSTRKKHSIIDDHDWASRQQPFPHTLYMPRAYKNFCTDCEESVVNGDKTVRHTRGVYLPIEHQCNRVRVYDLAGKLLEVKQI